MSGLTWKPRLHLRIALVQHSTSPCSFMVRSPYTRFFAPDSRIHFCQRIKSSWLRASKVDYSSIRASWKLLAVSWKAMSQILDQGREKFVRVIRPILMSRRDVFLYFDLRRYFRGCCDLSGGSVQGIPLTASLLSRIRSSYSISEAILDQRGNYFWVFEGRCLPGYCDLPSGSVQGVPLTLLISWYLCTGLRIPSLFHTIWRRPFKAPVDRRVEKLWQFLIKEGSIWSL